ncbi:conserved phage C-terminal domain-containing protein [Aerococcus viridans]|uniref:conserved phage C-terminal domain-containing protein n=1 Tax=Aerococcus viridans TaxID=1377 RepID=UPI003AA9A31E
MAQRRMFSRKITESDQFLDMPMSAQVLYFHINMQADDDGFVGNAKTIKRMIGASDDDLKLLIAKQFLIPFETGIVVIRDWKIHNYIQKDRYSETFYQHEKAQLETLGNKQYQRMDTECIQDVSSLDTQVRLGKDRLGKERDIQSSSDELDDIPYIEIIDYLNEKTNSQFRNSTKKTKTLIKARYAEGFNLDDFKKVIDIKVTEWLNDTKMNKFLRPETLFGTKFESYLNQKAINNRTEYNPNAEINEELGF